MMELAVVLYALVTPGLAGPLGCPHAPKGGVFTYHRAAEPPSLNPIVADGHSSADIQFHVIEPLLITDSDTYEWIPALADRWRRLPGGRAYEFHIRQGAKWSDGRPVTAEDVKFSFDVLFNPAFPTAHMRPYYESISSIEIVDARTVRFHVRDTAYANFISSAGLPIVPKHIYEDPRIGPKLHDRIVGSGPYVFKEWKKGVRIVLSRNPEWWGLKSPAYKGAYNPDTIIFRFIGNPNVAQEMLKRGEIDFMNLSADEYVKSTNSPAWGVKVFKAKVSNLYPKSYQFIAWNLDRPLFKDVRVRRALALLMDRDLIVKKFNFGLTVPATGPWYRQSVFADPSVNEVPFDPAKALALLKTAGWDDKDGDGVLEKDGARLEFTILMPSKAAERYLTVFQQDALKAGVAVRLKVIDGSQLASVLDHRDFDAVHFDWGGGLVDFDPKSMWHSSSIGPGGNNFSGYKNPRVDRLIELARHTSDRSKRIPLMRAIYRMIANDAPALFLFNENYSFYAYSDRVGRPTETYRYDVGTKYWWVKPKGESVGQIHH